MNTHHTPPPHPAHHHIANTIIPRKLKPEDPSTWDTTPDTKWNKIPQGEPVLIWWWDAVTQSTDWENPEDTNYTPEPTITIGFLWEHTPTQTTLTALANTTNHAHTLTIPTGCIHTIQHLKTT